MRNGWIVIGIGGASCSGKTTLANELHKKLPQSVIIHQDDYFYPVGSPKLEYVEEVNHYNWDKLSAIDVDRMVEAVEKIISTPATKQQHIMLIEGHVIYNITSIAILCTQKYLMTVAKETSRFRRRTRQYKRYDERYFDQYAWPFYEQNRDKVLNMYSDLVMLDGDLVLDVNEKRILCDIVNLEMKQKLDANEPMDTFVLVIEGTLVLNEPRLRNLCSLKYYLTLPYEISKERRYQKQYEIPDPPMNFDKIVWPQYLKYKSELDDTTISFIAGHEYDVSAILHMILKGLSHLCLNLEN